jgi:predicted DNA-binding transcriptional regulator AlpA
MTAPALSEVDFLLTVRDVAELLSVTVRTVWQMEAARQIPKAKRITKKVVRWKGSEIQAYIDSLDK